MTAIQTPHWDQTRRAMGQHPTVLILHDTTELDVTSHPALDGVGPIGNGSGRGFLQHNSLAVVPEPRQVLGLAYQQLELRRAAPDRETASQRRDRDRESELWVRGIEASGRPPAGSRWVDVGDRGADLYEAMRVSQKLGHDFLFRAARDRQVWRDESRVTPVKMREYATSMASPGGDEVEIPARGGRASRTTRVDLAAGRVWVPAPVGTPGRKGQPVVAAWVVRIWESDPPVGVEPLDWVLVTSVPTETAADIRERRDGYGCRWLVEVFHDIATNGCGEEDRRFETAARMGACLAILSLVAVRVFQLRTALDRVPRRAGVRGGDGGRDRGGGAGAGDEGSGTADGAGVRAGGGRPGRVLGTERGRRARGPDRVAGLPATARPTPGLPNPRARCG